jgi:hypothetical protein
MGHDLVKVVSVGNQEPLANIEMLGEGDFSGVLQGVVGIMVTQNPYYLSTEGFLSEPIYDLFVRCRQLCLRVINDIPVKNNRAVRGQGL